MPLHEEEITSTNISKGPPRPAQSTGGVAESVTPTIDSVSSSASQRHDQNVDGRERKERLLFHCSKSSPPSKKHCLLMNNHDARDRDGGDDPTNCTIPSDPLVSVTWRLDLTTTELECLSLFRKRPPFENQDVRSGWTAKLLFLANGSHHSLSYSERNISGPTEDITRHAVARITGRQDRVAPLHEPQTTGRNDDGLARMPAAHHHDSDSVSLQWSPPRTMRHSISGSPHKTDFWDNCEWKWKK